MAENIISHASLLLSGVWYLIKLYSTKYCVQLLSLFGSARLCALAICTKMAPSFANLFLGIFETNALAPFHPHTWWRYLDDIFMIWTEGLDHLKIFVDYLNNIHPIVAYGRTSNLRDILIKARLPTITTPNNTSLPPGSFRCGATCLCITNGLPHYTFFSIGATRQIKSHIERFSVECQK